MTQDQTTTTQEQPVQQTSSPTQALDAPNGQGGEIRRDHAADPDGRPEVARDRPSRAAPEPGERTPSAGTTGLAAAEPTSGGDREKPALVARVTEQRLRRIGVWSTTAVAAVVGVLTALVVFLAGVGVWLLASESGLVARGEDLVSAVTTDGTFALDSGSLLAGWAFLAGLWAVTLTLLGFVLAVIVNTACALTGGIRLTLLSKPSGRTMRRRAQLAAARDAAHEHTHAPDRGPSEQAHERGADPTETDGRPPERDADAQDDGPAARREPVSSAR